MSELAKDAPRSIWQSAAKGLVPHWLAVFCCRLGWMEHPDAGHWRRAAYRLHEEFLEDWAMRSRCSMEK